MQYYVLKDENSADFIESMIQMKSIGKILKFSYADRIHTVLYTINISSVFLLEFPTNASNASEL